VVTFGIIQLLAPGFGDAWFGDAYRPAGWIADQGRPYYLTQLAVIAVVTIVAVGFWYIGSRNLNSVGTARKAAAAHKQAKATESADKETASKESAKKEPDNKESASETDSKEPASDN
jgi:uncharacterized membrane protein YcjF (UPF0283 family)